MAHEGSVGCLSQSLFQLGAPLRIPTWVSARLGRDECSIGLAIEEATDTHCGIRRPKLYNLFSVSTGSLKLWPVWQSTRRRVRHRSIYRLRKQGATDQRRWNYSNNNADAGESRGVLLLGNNEVSHLRSAVNKSMISHNILTKTQPEEAISQGDSYGSSECSAEPPQQEMSLPLISLYG